MEYKFVFDLDSTITKQEILPIIAKKNNLFKEIEELTEKAMNGNQSFEENLKKRINLIKSIPLNEMYKLIKNIEYNEYIKKFILENKKRCIILTSNIDLIVKPILEDLDMLDKYFSSKAIEKENKIFEISEVMDKEYVSKNFKFNFVAIGDGANDIGMLKNANIKIAFGGSRKPPKELIQISDYVFYNDKDLYKFLNTIL